MHAALILLGFAVSAHAGDPLKGCESSNAVPAPALDRRELSPFRQEIVRLATQEIGEVSNVPDPASTTGRRRTGWDHLLSYWKAVAGEDLSEKPGENHKTLEKRNALINPQYYAHTEWCGIFAFWAWKTAATNVLDQSRRPSSSDVNECIEEATASPDSRQAIGANLSAVLAARWKSGLGMGGQLPYVGLPKNPAARQAQLRHVKPGDVMAFDNGKQHLSIVEAIVGDDLYTIDANQSCGMTVRRKRSLAKTPLLGYFRAD